MPIPAAAMFAASSALSMMQGVASHGQATAQADAQNETVRRTNELNRKNAYLAYDSYDNNVAALYARHSQEQQGLAQALVSAQKQALQAQAHVKAKGAQAGFRGGSFNTILRDLAGQMSRNQYAYATNQQNMERQLGRSHLGLYHDTLTKVNNPMLATPALYPSGWASTLSMGGDVLNNYAKYMKP